MIRVTGFYRWRPGAWFDHEYYGTKHVALALALLRPLGLIKLESDRFLTPSAPAEGTIVAATYAYFASSEEARAALEAVGAELLASVPHYSSMTPELVMSIVTVHG